MENIYAIVISDFLEKIHFIAKKLTFDYEQCIRIIKSLNKSLAANYLKEFVANGLEMRLIDTMINSKMKMKISIVGEIIVEMIYDSNVDFNYLNIINQRLLEGLFFIEKTKKMKTELLHKRFQEVNQILEDSLYLLDPRVRLTSKNANLNMKEAFNHTIYSMKFNMTASNLRNTAFLQSSKDFNSVKETIDGNKKLKSKYLITSIPLNSELAKIIKINKKTKLNEYSLSPAKNDVRNKKTNENMNSKTNASNSSKNDKNMLLGIDFNVTSKDARESSSINMKFNENTLDIDNKIRSSSLVNKGLKEINSINVPENNNLIPPKNNGNNINMTENMNQYSTVEKAIISLGQVDLNGVLESINFDDTSLNSKNAFYSNSNISIKSESAFSNNKNSQSLNRSFDLKATSSSKNKNLIPNSDLSISSNPKIYSTNVFNFNENILHQHAMPIPAEQGKKNYDLSNFENLLQIGTSSDEDIFDKSIIRKQVRGVILEKGILLNNKGKYEDVKYRGQIALELTNNFFIKNKTFFLKIFHPNWNESSCFKKLIPEKNTVEDQNFGNYKISCKNVKSFLRLIDYNINIKMIEPAAEFKVTGTHKEDKYKLEIKSVINSKIASKMKGIQMNIVIITKSNQLNILKATNTNYTIEDKIINYTINDFTKEERMLIGLVFQTMDKEFVEVVKITYRYMDVLPTANNGELLIYDEFNQPFSLDMVKKCLVEVRFTP